MRKNIASAIARLQRSGEQASGVHFSYEGDNGSRTVRGNLFYRDGLKIDVNFTTIDGYNTQYIRTRTKTLLNEILNEVLPYAQDGDEVWTKSHLNGLRPGDQVTLNSSDYYYAVNNGIINCGGREFGRSCYAQFKEYDEARCSPGGAIMKFSIFLLNH